MALDDTWPVGTASSVDHAWVEQFKDECIHLAQQKGSKLRNAVRNVMCKAKTHNFERLGPSDAVQKTTRHTPPPIVDVAHSRRRVDLDDYLWGDLIDHEDAIRILINAQSEYSANAGYAMGRKWDDLILTGMYADATDGAGAAVVFDTANQQIASGTTGMTIEKLTEAKYIMDSNDVPENDRYIAIAPKQLQDLLNTTEITSADYNTVKALVKGEINTFLGFDFITSSRVDQTDLLVAGETNCIAFQKNCVGLAVGQDVQIKVDERPDVSYATQVFARFSCNATRIDDAGVVSILNAYA
jgi:hypothetical protein